MRALLEAILLGVVQGLTEFVPVSSSGHLVLVPYLLRLEPHGLAFDVALHVGTLGAVLVYFRVELVAMTRGLLGIDRSPDGMVYRKLALLIVVGSVPVAIAGLALEDFFADVFTAPAAAAGFLFVTAALLVTGERLRDRRVRAAVPATAERAPTVMPVPDQGRAHRLPLGRDPADPAGLGLDGMGVREAVLVGLAQCLALFPGLSRSGCTIAAGMAGGLSREAATRFSFLLALPALLGAGLLSAPDVLEPGSTFSAAALVAGVVAAFVSGYLAIRFLVALVASERLTGFAVYCAVAGAVGLVGFAVLG